MMQADAVVIGSGISGLTAAALLAKKGRKVIVVERTARLGGALKRFKRQGIPFDVGFHYTGCLGNGEILAMLWDYLGVRPRLAIRPFPADGHDALSVAGCDQVVKAYFSYDLFGEELRRVFPKEQHAIGSYLDRIRAICREVPFYNTDLALTPFLRGFKDNPLSLQEYLPALTADRHLQAVLAAPAFLYGVPLSRAALEVHATVAHGFYSGAYAIDGGGQAVVDAFLEVLAQDGVTLLKQNKVEKILVEENRVAGIITDQDLVISCRDVIYTGHPSALPAMVPADVFRPVYRKRLQELRNTCSMFAVFATAPGPETQGPDWVNHYHIPTGLNILPETSEVPLSQRALMMSVPERNESISLKEMSRGIILLQPALWHEVERFTESSPRNRPDAYLAWKDELAAEMIAAARKHWGEIYGRIRPLAVGTPLTFRDELAAPEGAAYGAQHCLGQYNPAARTRLPGLWLSGQSTLMTGVVGAALAGLVSAGEILGLESIWNEVRRCR
jgi:all-trans-retinol 13,14-reductase